jgi:phosphoribosylformylglycinamidine (FGAM) synthase-like enzyme
VKSYSIYRTTKNINLLYGVSKVYLLVAHVAGLTFDEDDVRFYTDLFRKMGRNPTNVELFDLAQSNSEHSRHWFFNVRHSH